MAVSTRAPLSYSGRISNLMRTRRRRGLGILLLGACAVLVGCGSVQPWERGNLARPQMAFERNPGQAELRAHVYSSREAAPAATAWPREAAAAATDAMSRDPPSGKGALHALTAAALALPGLMQPPPCAAQDNAAASVWPISRRAAANCTG